ncbi:hypothetical protein L1999_20265 [Neobacillus drentensis]|uniref:hypothetical protein n=1 Tax=Neobacillus drentensis TaxID=220684 RepID=UPI001F44EA64|nr:hypothetical protein [Neobacillus drentensis]ULT55419.1 hypothetical protein L1999_20265 [Neobacillus drentensis]
MVGILDEVEEKDIRITEKRLLKYRRKYIYVALEEVEDAEFIWSLREVREFEELWDRDIPLSEIAETLERTEFSCLLLSLDRVMNGKIKPRKGWCIW